jgi:ATP-dependent DNA helicase RecQ
MKKSSNREIKVVEPEKKTGLGTKLTQLETLELFNNGLSIREIAQKREVAESTIVSHLCFLIEKKLIKDIDKLVSSKKQKFISEAIEKVGSEKLKPIKEELGEKASYDEIKIYLASTKLT